MKSTLIRVLTIATLATSMSAFAATDEPKHSDAASTSATAQQDGCAERTQDKKQKKAKPQRDEQRQNDKDFDLGIYG